MNSEALIKDSQRAIGLFREIFKATITEMDANGNLIRELNSRDIMSSAYRFLKAREWYIEEMGVCQSDLGHFDAVMADYLTAVQDFLSYYNAGNESLPAALHQLFS